ncbi:hypothetical protein ACF3M1_16685 [Luteimonas sp. WGS1318]|uniref:hypothetical protein n=1 Tax=Luteimonas sp. WGS1318 TaxID=3366815 RepID=UPI00372D3819
MTNCISQFNEKFDDIERLFYFCLSSYQKNSVASGITVGERLSSTRTPFSSHHGLTGAMTGCTFNGSFQNTLREFGVLELIERWIGPPPRRKSIPISSFSAYFSLITYAGLAYLLNFSLMRLSECWSLRSDCLENDKDEFGNDIFLVRGETTKTVTDRAARWIVPEFAKQAVLAMSRVARLRVEAGSLNPRFPITEADLRNPHLAVRAFEPWAAQKGQAERTSDIRHCPSTYRSILSRYPKLIDQSVLSITEEDLSLARLITPSIDPELYSVGKNWPLSWHQLRRTGAVNMASSGLVSDSSLQFQLKHASRAMSRYYTRRHYFLKLGLNDDAQSEFLKALYESFARDSVSLCGDRFASPLGPKHKDAILATVSSADHKRLTKLASEGAIPYRENILGVCTNPNPCDKGGVESVAPCAGGRAVCTHLLVDREKSFGLKGLREILSSRLADSEPGSPLHDSLVLQIKAIDVALSS